MKDLLGRLARKWWLMLVLGVVIGLAAGLPVGGKVMPGKLAGTAEPEIRRVTYQVGAEFFLRPYYYAYGPGEDTIMLLPENTDVIKILSDTQFKFKALKPGKVQVWVASSSSISHLLGAYIVTVTQ